MTMMNDLKKSKSIRKYLKAIKLIDNKTIRYNEIITLLRKCKSLNELNMLESVDSYYNSQFNRNRQYDMALNFGLQCSHTSISLFNHAYNSQLSHTSKKGKEKFKYGLDSLNLHDSYDRVTLNIFIKHSINKSLSRRIIWELYYLVMVKEGHLGATLPPEINIQFNDHHNIYKSKLEHLITSSSTHNLHFRRHTCPLYKYFIRLFKLKNDMLGYKHLINCYNNALFIYNSKESKSTITGT